MKCPYCNGSSLVIDTATDSDVIIRRRRCKDCDSRFYTQEIDISFDKGKKMMSEIRAREKLNIN